MHTAITATPLLRGRKEPVDAILVHAGQLLLAGPSSSIAAYRLPAKSGDEDGDRSDAQPQSLDADRPAWTVRLSRSAKTIEQIKVIREANLFVSLIDATVALHDIASVQEVSSSARDAKAGHAPLAAAPTLPVEASTVLSQTKGAISLAMDTSIQRSPQPADKLTEMGGAGVGAGYRFRAGPSTLGRAYRPSDATQGRRGGDGRTSFSPSTSTMRNTTRPMSLLAMEDIKRDKEEKRRFMTMHAGSPAAARGSQRPSDEDVMCVVSTLCIGCRRKLVIFRWIDGAFWDTKEINLPHTPRTLAFPTPTTLFMGYTATEYAILTMPLASESSVADLLDVDRTAARATIPMNSVAGPRVDLYEWGLKTLDIPLPGALTESGQDGGSASSVHQSQHGGTQTTSAATGYTAMAGAALTGLSGYMSLAAKNKPLVVQIEGGEVLVCRESLGVFLNEDGKPTRRDGIEWRAVPDEVAYVKPYVLSVVPSIVRQTPAYPTLQVCSASTLAVVQSLPFPPAGDKASTAAGNYPSVRLLTSSAGNKPPVYVKVAPTERGALERDGLSIWSLGMKGWGRQIDELVEAGEYQEALGLLHSVDDVLLDDKEQRKAHIEALYAVSLFAKGQYSEAIDLFLELDINPARVIALYPSYIAGPLSRSRSHWLEMFGGKTVEAEMPSEQAGAIGTFRTTSPLADDNASIRSGRSAARPMPRDRSILHGFWGRRPQSIVGGETEELATSPAPSLSKASPVQSADSKMPKDDARPNTAETGETRQDPPEDPSKEAVGVTPKASLPQPTDDERKAIDALGGFLADRRRIYKPILELQPASHSIAMSQVKRDPAWLLDLPSKPLGTLEMGQLLAVAQTVDTALFKTFLATKPGLIGSLCRLENWCEVTQVEELLLQRQKFSELIALYAGKEMHDKALSLLRKMSEAEEDVHAKVEPTVRYLQNLDPAYIDIILRTSHWIAEVDRDSAMEIFCADTGKVSGFPRFTIVADLEKFDTGLCVRFLEHLVYKLGEGDPGLHEKLATLLLRRAEASKEGVDRKEALEKLTGLLEYSHQYRAERILNRVPTDQRDFHDVRALLFGRLGQHEAALRIYVDKLSDHGKAEEYCKRIAEEQPKAGVFLTLLRIYLRPKRQEKEATTSTSLKALQLEPALAIITKYGARLDAKAAMELIPLHVPVSAVEAFASKALRQTSVRRCETGVIASLAKERALQTDETMTALHRRRVRITEQRTCPRCMKRLGNSVVAVTTEGAVLHYGCSSLSNGDESSRASPR